MQTTSGTTYEEFQQPPSMSQMNASPHETFSWDGMAGTRWVHCAWADRFNLLNDLFFTFPDCTFPYGGGGLLMMARTYPFGGITGVGDMGVSHDRCAIELIYRVVDFEYVSARTNAYCAETIEPYQDKFYVGHEGLYWDTQGKKPLSAGQNPTFTANGFDFVIEQVNVLTLNPAALPAYYCVNADSVPIYTLNFSAPPETLLYHPPKIVRAAKPGAITSARTFRLTFRFSFRASGWNTHFNTMADGVVAGTKGNWGNIYDSSGNRVVRYPSLPFNGFL